LTAQLQSTISYCRTSTRS